MWSACSFAVTAISACLHASAATMAAPQLELQPALGAAGLEDAAGVARELKSLGLSQLQDVRLLDAEEAREMMGALRGSAVSLGDRSRLRRVLAGPADSQRVVSGASDGLSVLVGRFSRSSGGRRAAQDGSEGPSGGGVSGDSLAIAATVLVALVGYAVRPGALSVVFCFGGFWTMPRPIPSS